MDDKHTRKYSSLTIYGRLIAQARPYWVHVSAFLLLSLLATPLALLAPVPLKIAVDCVIGARPLPPVVRTLLPGASTSDTSVLVLVAVLVVGIALLTQLHHLAASMLKTFVAENTMRRKHTRIVIMSTNGVRFSEMFEARA